MVILARIGTGVLISTGIAWVFFSVELGVGLSDVLRPEGVEGVVAVTILMLGAAGVGLLAIVGAWMAFRR